MQPFKILSPPDRRGNSIAGRIYFRTLFETEPSHDDIVNAQTRMGYDPGGYDGPWGVLLERTEEGWEARWGCAASCD